MSSTENVSAASATSQASASPRVATAAKAGGISVTSLILLAILVAAGIILNITLGNALAMTGIKPQFVIAAYTLAILVANAKLGEAAIYGLISATIIQISTSIPGLNFVTELAGALVACLVARVALRTGKLNATPLVAGFVATLVSGGLFAVLGSVLMGADVATALVKVPVVLGTAVFNAVVVQALIVPIRAALRR